MTRPRAGRLRPGSGRGRRWGGRRLVWVPTICGQNLPLPIPAHILLGSLHRCRRRRGRRPRTRHPEGALTARPDLPAIHPASPRKLAAVRRPRARHPAHDGRPRSPRGKLQRAAPRHLRRGGCSRRRARRGHAPPRAGALAGPRARRDSWSRRRRGCVVRLRRLDLGPRGRTHPDAHVALLRASRASSRATSTRWASPRRPPLGWVWRTSTPRARAQHMTERTLAAYREEDAP